MIASIGNLLLELERQYPLQPTTYWACPRCAANARSSCLCAKCLRTELEALGASPALLDEAEHVLRGRQQASLALDAAEEVLQNLHVEVGDVKSRLQRQLYDASKQTDEDTE